MESIRREDLSPTFAYVYDKIYEDGIEQGVLPEVSQGIEQKAREIAVRLIKEGSEDGWIADVTGLSVKQVQEIRKRG
ncbi:hypothetical protein R6U77_15775 [Lysinibacillus louembei]|uniref:Transposase n=1 Tax=Lysinibacillus louembei TaxID=1470088 RepID=A0ABZ0RWB4_9BACI|nr:hypothetical protein [Lysinibacillus louembei]WPK11331.1 hypothetical protein R6U77_15775 [Lysinibacillus louembei]